MVLVVLCTTIVALVIILWVTDHRPYVSRITLSGYLPEGEYQLIGQDRQGCCIVESITPDNRIYRVRPDTLLPIIKGCKLFRVCCHGHVSI